MNFEAMETQECKERNLPFFRFFSSQTPLITPLLGQSALQAGSGTGTNHTAKN
jgi:hypothetical protein